MHENKESSFYYEKLQEAINYENIAKLYEGQSADENEAKDLIEFLKLSPHFDHT